MVYANLEGFNSCLILNFKNSELPNTDNELKLMAAPAIMGLSTNPLMGISTPAAIGMANKL
jgi:hypothetical protein